MTKYSFARTAFALLILLACYFPSAAREGKPVLSIHTERIMPAHVLTDTVPPVQKTTEEKPAQEKPATTTTPVIKVVPKARKQIKPVALPGVPLKPSKIIKPVIKRVGALI